jgi:RHS repeat-associated protein
VEKNIDDADTNAFRYCGEYYDAETGTIYLRARHYNPNNGRFTQRDSFAGKQGDPLSLNLYTYCHNNPVYYSDPSGHFVIALPALAIAAAAVVVVATTAVVVSNNPQAQQSFNEMTYDVERGLNDLVDSSKKGLNKVKAWGKSLAVKAKNTYETTKTVATVAGTSIITNTLINTISIYNKYINQSSVTLTVNASIGYPGNDATQPPSSDWEWRGKGEPGSGEGNYYNPKTGESLHPDLGHGPPIGPHWDYKNKGGEWGRLYPDGSFELK